MDVEQFRAYMLAKKGVTEEFPFGPDALVFKVMGKMFGITDLSKIPFQANLKQDPEKSLELRDTYDGRIIPGFHMNKKHWNTHFMQELPTELLHQLIDDSYHLVVSKLTKKQKEELEQL